MLQRFWLVLILILTHSAVAALTFTITRYWMQQAGGPLPAPTENLRSDTPSTELPFERFVKDMMPYAKGHSASIRSDLLLTLQVSDQLDSEDQQLVARLNPDDVTDRQLAEIKIARSFLDSYSNTKNVNVFAFTSEKYHQLLKDFIGQSAPSPERAIAARKQLCQLANSFFNLREKAIKLPYTETDNRLHFLEMLRDLESENYSDVKKSSEPVLPLLSDRDGLLLSSVEKWLNSSHAQKALPIEQFHRLYRDGKIHVFSSDFSSYLPRIKSHIREELAKTKESQGTISKQLDSAYSSIETFFIFLAQLSR